MKLVIPTSTSTAPGALEALEGQTMPVEVCVVKNEERFISDPSALPGEELRRRYAVIGRSRNKCLPVLRTEEVAVMQDSSLVHKNTNNLQEMYDLLMSNDQIVAVSLAMQARWWYKIEHPHMRNGCIMARKVVWENADFTPKGGNCTCMTFTESAR